MKTFDLALIGLGGGGAQPIRARGVVAGDWHRPIPSTASLRLEPWSDTDHAGGDREAEHYTPLVLRTNRIWEEIEAPATRSVADVHLDLWTVIQ